MSESLCQPKNDAIHAYSMEHLPISDRLTNAQALKQADQFNEAIELYVEIINTSDVCDAKYVACFELFDCYNSLNRSDDGLSYLSIPSTDNIYRIECIYRLIRHFCCRNDFKTAHMHYTHIQEYFENKYPTDDISQHLFTHKNEYEFFLPYYMIIVYGSMGTEYIGNIVRMYECIFKAKNTTIDSWWIQNLFYNIELIVDHIDPIHVEFIDLLLEYRTEFQRRNVKFTSEINKNIEKLINRFHNALTKFPNRLPNLLHTTDPGILFTITTCKRLDLFEKTMNSILNTWTDLSKIDYFLCVDDNSSDSDRSIMRAKYPFFDFHMKSSNDKGHRSSMNFIWNKLNELRPKYWIHLEDDWLFFKNDNYVTRSVNFLEKYNSANIHQILFNRNYAELYADSGWNIQGGEVLEPDYLLHLKSDNIPGPNCAYWPHYSFRPSMVNVDKILELGNYDSNNTFFERDYADRWFEKGYKSAFFNTITCMHIGKLTSDKSGTNAYTLNNTAQFGNSSVTPTINTFVVNLKRRPDRRKTMEELFTKHDFKDYAFYEAVDGKELIPTVELANLFRGNDFGSRRGVIGCALTHYNLWKQLIADPKFDYYVIFEDDINLVTNFNDRYRDALKYIEVNKVDILYLGYSSQSNVNDTICDSDIIKLDLDKYIGGFFSYIITKSGANTLLEYISLNGITHGIDYLIKILPDINAVNIHPHIVHTEWVKDNMSDVDSDIQKDYSCLNFDMINQVIDDWVFYPKGDHGGDDIKFVGRKTTNELLSIAMSTPSCVAFNTLGFLKSNVTLPLKPSKYFNKTDGTYIKRSRKKYTRIKMLCNWCSSEELCKEWNKMTMGNYIWNNIQITWEDSNIDYYIIINKPQSGAYFIPEKTIIFHMEPWCGEDWQTWGIKTWGEWAKPDPAKFLQVRSHDKYFNTCFWQIPKTYNELKCDQIYKVESLGNTIASICSSKYFDTGHKYRIDFMKFIESKADPIVKLNIYNSDNTHSFKSYVGAARPDIDKDKGILPYKYYFMCENNAEHNFITEKLWEPILCETLCFYWGCPNVTDYIDPLAYVQLDMTDFEKSFQIIKNAIETNLWEERLPILRKEKQKILQQYGFFPTVEQTIQDNLYREHFTDASDIHNICFIHSCNLESAGTKKLDLLLENIKKNGLFNILDLIVIQNCGIELDATKYSSKKIKLIQYSSCTSYYELPTLRLIHKFSQDYPNVKLLYLHTKSISYSKDDNKYAPCLDWIMYMLYFLVDQYTCCLPLLDTHDTLGCNYSSLPKPHYSGNFWWANTNYLKTLDVDDLTDKMSAEMWLHSKLPKYKILHSSNINHFMELYSRDRYIS